MDTSSGRRVRKRIYLTLKSFCLTSGCAYKIGSEEKSLKWDTDGKKTKNDNGLRLGSHYLHIWLTAGVQCVPVHHISCYHVGHFGILSYDNGPHQGTDIREDPEPRFRNYLPADRREIRHCKEKVSTLLYPSKIWRGTCEV